MNAQLIVPHNNSFLLQCKGSIYELDSSNLQLSLVKFSHSSRVEGIDIRGQLIASIENSGIVMARKLNPQSGISQIISYYAPQKQSQGCCVNIR